MRPRILPQRIPIFSVLAAAAAALMLLLAIRPAEAAMNASTVSPDIGPTAGGTIVTITGTGFPAACASPAVTVTIGGANAPLQAPVAATEIKVFTPPHAAGSVDILIEDNCGADQDLVTDGFTYVDSPEVIGISPDAGLNAGGTTVTIFGNNFVDGATVKFGTAAATDVDFVSEHKLTAKTPAGTGTVGVTVTNPDTQANTLATAFTYGTGSGAPGTIISGSIPVAGGFGLFVFGGGTSQQLLTASGCPQATATFYATNAQGGFVTYIPGSGVQAVNAAWNTLFANGIPPTTALIGKCV